MPFTPSFPALLSPNLLWRVSEQVSECVSVHWKPVCPSSPLLATTCWTVLSMATLLHTIVCVLQTATCLCPLPVDTRCILRTVPSFSTTLRNKNQCHTNCHRQPPVCSAAGSFNPNLLSSFNTPHTQLFVPKTPVKKEFSAQYFVVNKSSSNCQHLWNLLCFWKKFDNLLNGK